MRRPKLTPELTEKICRMVKVGIPAEAAARACGVPLEQFAEWMARGLGEHPEKKATPRYRAFARAIEQAEGEAIALHAATLAKAARDGAWRASAWWLSRRGGQRWSNAETTAVLVPYIAKDGRQHMLPEAMAAQIRAMKSAPYVDPRLDLPEGDPDAPLGLVESRPPCDDGTYIDPSRRPNVVIVDAEPTPEPTEPAS